MSGIYNFLSYMDSTMVLLAENYNKTYAEYNNQLNFVIALGSVLFAFIGIYMSLISVILSFIGILISMIVVR